MIDCIIIEDEPLAAIKLSDFAGRMKTLNLQKVFDNGADALSFLVDHTTDLIFLDICMAEMNGLQLLDALMRPPKIIITSAESSYALKSYEYDVSDYLLKPFGFDRFVKAVNKVADELVNAGTLSENHQTPSCIFVKTEYRIERVDLAELSYVEGMKDYLSLVLPERKIMTLMSFQELMELLPANDFVRVHKSFVVAPDKIRSIEKNRIRIGDQLIPISDTYRDQFMELLRRRKNMI